jgi:hypothetical protein
MDIGVAEILAGVHINIARVRPVAHCGLDGLS